MYDFQERYGKYIIYFFYVGLYYPKEKETWKTDEEPYIFFNIFIGV